jgi:hypothetical protein
MIDSRINITFPKNHVIGETETSNISPITHSAQIILSPSKLKQIKSLDDLRRSFHLLGVEDETPLSDVPGILYEPSELTNKSKSHLVITCAGAGGGKGFNGFYGPSELYNKLGEILPNKFGFSVLQIAYTSKSVDDHYRIACTDLDTVLASVIDKYDEITLIGWSMGSAVITNNAYKYRSSGKIKNFIIIAGQNADTNRISELDINALLLYGEVDPVFEIRVGRDINRRLDKTKNRYHRMIALPKNNHDVVDALPHIIDFFDYLQQN